MLRLSRVGECREFTPIIAARLIVEIGEISSSLSAAGKCTRSFRASDALILNGSGLCTCLEAGSQELCHDAVAILDVDIGSDRFLHARNYPLCA